MDKETQELTSQYLKGICPACEGTILVRLHPTSNWIVCALCGKVDEVANFQLGNSS